MPFLDSRYVQVPSLQDYFVDKDTGAPLSAGIVTFYEDNNHTVLKPVYQLTVTPSNNYIYNVLPDPLQLSSVGTFIDENGNDIIPYFFPYDGTPTTTTNTLDLYFITVYSSSGVLQFTRDAWPNLSPAGNTTGNLATTENQLANPQFSQVNFPKAPAPAYTFNVSGTNQVTNIAPNWDVITNGIGSVTVQQIASTNITLPSNSPFLLDIVSSGAGLTGNVQLRQRLFQDPRLLVNGNANGSFVIGSQDGNSHLITMTYVPSNAGATSYTLISQVIPATGFNQYSGTQFISGTVGVNPDSPLTPGYIDIIINIPPTAHVQITSAQLVGVPNDTIAVNFIEQTTQREADHLFHYYQYELIIKPKDTILTGWDFPLNPYQANTSVFGIATSACSYIADQTILWQQNASSLGSGQSALAFNEALAIGANPAGSAANQFALIQYIDPTSCRPYWNYFVSSLARILLFSSHGTQVGIKMRLIINNSLPPHLSSTEPIVSLTGSTITFGASWLAISPLNDPTYILPTAFSPFESPGAFAFPTFSFDAFPLPSLFSANQTLGIVIYTTAPINQTSGSPDVIVFDSISLVPNRFAVQTNPKTTDQVLRECEFYYEKSYDTGTLPATATVVGQQTYQQNFILGGGNMAFYPGIFNIDLRTTKRTDPLPGNVAIYSPSTGAVSGFGLLFLNGALVNSGDVSLANYAVASLSTKYIAYSGTGNTALLTTGIGSTTNPYTILAFQYVVDVRLGL